MPAVEQDNKRPRGRKFGKALPRPGGIGKLELGSLLPRLQRVRSVVRSIHIRFNSSWTRKLPGGTVVVHQMGYGVKAP